MTKAPSNPFAPPWKRQCPLALERRLALIFALLGSILTGLIVLHWFLVLEPTLRAEAESRARVLAEAQVQRLEQLFDSDRLEVVLLREELTTALDSLLLLRERTSEQPFIKRIELEMDDDLLPVIANGALSLARGAPVCTDCFIAEIPLYHPRTHLLAGIATLYSNSYFLRQIIDDVRGKLLVGTTAALSLIVLAWFGVSRLLRRLGLSEANLYAVFEAAPFALLLHETGRPGPRLANEAAKRYLQLQQDITGYCTSACWQALQASGLDWPAGERREISLPGRHGETRWALVSVIPLRLAGLSGQLISLTDVSEIKAIQDELRLASLTDGLTGLYNRRYLFQKLARESELADKTGQTFAVILFDLDHFKSINDRFGHQVGDQVLVRIAQELRRCLREVDVAGRYGGEEFMVILPACALHDAREVAERIRRSVSELTWTQPGLRVTISGGLALRLPGIKVDALIEVADGRLYQAKETGRNQIIG